MKTSKFDFVGKRKIWVMFSLCLIAATILFTLVIGANLDIQFSGGTMITYSFEGEVDQNLFLSTVEEAAQQSASVQEQRDVATGKMNYIVTLSSKSGITPEQQGAITTALTATFPQNNLQVESLSNVDPSIGKDFMFKSLVAVIVAAALIIIYVAFRFRKMGGLSAGVVGVCMLLHDVIIVYAVFLFARIPLNDNFIAVMLTIFGYSINNTIIIYDRIRENRRILGGKSELGDLINLSINQSMRRSVFTTVTTVLAMAVVCVVSIVYNVSSIISFALPLLVGLFAGFYSSVFLAGPVWGWWQDRKAAQ